MTNCVILSVIGSFYLRNKTLYCLICVEGLYYSNGQIIIYKHDFYVSLGSFNQSPVGEFI